jgi:hypothetical protein
MPYLFTPPGLPVRVGDANTFFLTLTFGRSLLKESGLYRQVLDPSDEEVAAAEIAYLGGHIYAISDDEAAALTLAGYAEGITSISLGSGFGEGPYGATPYGGA